MEIVSKRCIIGGGRIGDILVFSNNTKVKVCSSAISEVVL